MKRRDFIATLGSAAAWPLAARAQQDVRRVGVLAANAEATAVLLIRLREELPKLGWIEGRNLRLDIRGGDFRTDLYRTFAAELVNLRPDVIVTTGTPATMAVQQLTRTIPIVTIIPEDPVAAGFAQSIAKPGGNVTGTWNLGDDALVGKKLDFFKLAVPGLSRVGVMLNPDDPADSVQIPSLPAAARAVGVTMEVIEVRDLGNLDAAAAQIMRASVQGLFVGVAPFWLSARAQITAIVARLKLPAMYGWREFADVGGLMSLRPQSSRALPPVGQSGR